MRILIFSDHHGHAWKPYSLLNERGVNNRLADGIHVLQQVGELAKAKGADVVLFLGDLFHARGSIHVQTFNLIYDEIAKMCMYCPVGMLVGNHDQTNKTGDVHSVYAMRVTATVMDTPDWYQFRDSQENTLHVLAVPYHPDKDHLIGHMKRLAADPPTNLEPTILIGHFGIDGAIVGGNFVLVDEHAVKTSELPEGNLDYMFLGHYHQPQQLSENAYYIGATHQHNWGDSGQRRGCMIWDTEETAEHSEPTFFDLVAPKFVKVAHGREVEVAVVRNNYVRVMLSSAINKSLSDQYADHLKSLGARSVEFMVTTEAAEGKESTTAFSTGMDIDKMLEGFVQESMWDIPDFDDNTLIDFGKEIMRQVQ